MTVSELQRYIEGAMWRLRTQATFDYCQANLIGISAARMMSNDVNFPPISEVYPDLFEQQTKAVEQVQSVEDTKMINNFLQRAKAINEARKRKTEVNDNK